MSQQSAAAASSARYAALSDVMNDGSLELNDGSLESNEAKIEAPTNKYVLKSFKNLGMFYSFYFRE